MSSRKNEWKRNRQIRVCAGDFVSGILKRSIKIVSQNVVSYKYNVKTELRNFSCEEVKEIAQQNTLSHALLCLNPDQDGNIGAMIRTAHLLGFSKVIVVGSRHYNKKSAVGAYSYIDVDYVKCDVPEGSFHVIDEDKACEFIRSFEEKYQIVFVEQDEGNSVNLRDVTGNYEKPLLIVMGSESSGIPKKILRNVNGITVEIPQRGVMRSFNVTAAFAMVAWHLVGSNV